MGKKAEKEKMDLESQMVQPQQIIRALENDKNKRQAELIDKKALLLKYDTEYNTLKRLMEESEKAALEKSGGRRIEESECFERIRDLHAHENVNKEKQKKLEDEYGS